MNEYDDESLDEYGDDIDSDEFYSDGFYSDEDYDDFIAQEFPDQASGSNSVKSHWRWTAWILVALFGLLWMWI